MKLRGAIEDKELSYVNSLNVGGFYFRLLGLLTMQVDVCVIEDKEYTYIK